MKSYSIAVLLAVSFSSAIMGQSGKEAIDDSFDRRVHREPHTFDRDLACRVRIHGPVFIGESGCPSAAIEVGAIHV